MNCDKYENAKNDMFLDDWDDKKVEEVKKEINNLIWVNANGDLTLDEADGRAVIILDIIRGMPQKGGAGK